MAAVSLSLLIFAALRVVGDSRCPTAGSVGRQLAAIADPASEVSKQRVDLLAIVEKVPEGVRLRLLDSNDRVLGTRLLRSDRPCESLALAAAVILANWSTELPAAPTPPPSRLVILSTGREEAEESPRSPWGGELRLGLLSSVAGSAAGSVAPGGMVEGTLAWGGALRAVVTLAAEAERPLAVPGGSADWQRLWIGAGPGWVLARGRARLEIRGELLAATVTAHGSGFTSNLASSSIDPGLSLGAVGELVFGSFALWASLEPAGWLFSHRVASQGQPTSQSVPQLELLGTAGIALRWGSETGP